MDWFIFVLLTLAWITCFAFFLEKKTILRTGITGAFILLFGASLLLTGISFPSGWTVVTSGSTQTFTQTFTDYTVTSNPFILGMAWLLIFAGLFLVLEVFIGLLTSMTASASDVKNKYGL